MFYAVALHGWTCKWAMSRGSLMKSTSSPNVQENKVSSPKIQTQHIIKQCAHACMQSHFSRVRLLATPWTVAHQAPLSMGSSRQELLERVAMPSSRGSSRPRGQICICCVSCIGRWVLYHQNYLGSSEECVRQVISFLLLKLSLQSIRTGLRAGKKKYRVIYRVIFIIPSIQN